MKRYFIHNPFFRLLAPVVFGVMAYLLILLINNNVNQVNDFFSSQEVYICIGLTYLLFESIRMSILLLNRYWPGRLEYARIPVQSIVSIPFSVSLVFIGLNFYFKYYEGFSISTVQLLIFLIIYTGAALLYNILYFSNHFLHKENTVRIAAEKQHFEVLEMEMLEFKNDINPDLLFESLESLINLMYHDAEEAEEYIDRLATAYRYVLTNRHVELVPLSVELEAARNLVTLLNQKYFGMLQLESSLDEEGDRAMLIPGSLPVIVENLVRNTIVSRFDPLVIRCYLEDDYITIQSQLNDRLMIHSDTELILSRLQKSYALYSDQPMIRVKAYEENYVKLPVIHVATAEATT